MDISFSAQAAAKLKCDALVIGLPEGWTQAHAAFAHLDAASAGLGGDFARVLKDEGFEGRAQQVVGMHALGRIGGKRIFAAGLGAEDAATDASVDGLRRTLGDISRRARNAGWKKVGFVLGSDSADVIRAATEGAALGAYRFDKYINADARKAAPAELKLLLSVDGGRANAGHKAALAGALSGATGTMLARELINEPANVVNPEHLAGVARDIASKSPRITVKVFDEKALTKAGMNLILQVGAASSSPPRLIHLTYKPAGKKKSTRKVFFVGKGVTFDAGGLSLKPGDSMKDMKCDMSGAAAVLGTMSAVAQLAPPFEVHGIVGAAENMVDGDSYRVGDIIRSYSGKTVEVLNTDAEGRLVLADALHYSVEQGATEIVNLATLTGACMVALGPYTSAVFSTDDTLADGIRTAGQRAGEDFWRMPLTAALRSKLDTPNADIKNIGIRWGGAITAALFLREFVGETRWAHLDIAGPAFLDEETGHLSRGGSGVGVRTLLSYLQASA